MNILKNNGKFMGFMIPYKDQRVEAAIVYFVTNHKSKTGENLCQTALYKYLAFFDFKSLEETGEPALGLTYKAMERGPVPVELYEDGKYWKSKYYFVEETPFTRNNDHLNKVIIIPRQVKDKEYLNYLSEYDKELMDKLLYFYAQFWITAKIMSDVSHSKKDGIKAWIKTWKRKQNSIIDMADEFDNLEEKYLNNTASSSEEHFYLYRQFNA